MSLFVQLYDYDYYSVSFTFPYLVFALPYYLLDKICIYMKLILGTPALTTRGFKETDIDKVVDFIDRGLQLAKEISQVSGPKMVDFKKVIHENSEFANKVSALRDDVEKFSAQFVLPGYPEY